jgi:hypothetical protein
MPNFITSSTGAVPPDFRLRAPEGVDVPPLVRRDHEVLASLPQLAALGRG